MAAGRAAALLATAIAAIGLTLGLHGPDDLSAGVSPWQGAGSDLSGLAVAAISAAAVVALAVILKRQGLL